MHATDPDADLMTETEQGWSRGPDRQLWRFLARRVPGRRLPLLGDRAVASLTFDDIPESVARVGAPIMERRGVRATVYVAAGLCGRDDRYWRVADRAQLRAMAEAGHELGCHTARHVNVQSLRGEELARECDRSAALIAELAGEEPVNFCYPFGDFGLWQKRYLGERFETCRTIYEHTNIGRVDLSLLGAYGLFDSTMDRARLEGIVRDAVARRGWLIFYSHDVEAQPTRMGMSPQLMDLTLDLLEEHDVTVMPIREAARFHGLVSVADGARQAI